MEIELSSPGVAPRISTTRPILRTQTVVMALAFSIQARRT
jgi:hypothetical protein